MLLVEITSPVRLYVWVVALGKGGVEHTWDIGKRASDVFYLRMGCGGCQVGTYADAEQWAAATTEARR